MEITKARILRGYDTCSTMINHWGNGRDPGRSYRSSVEAIRDILGSLLKVDDEILENLNSKEKE